MSVLSYGHIQDVVPFRYGLEKIPADISKQELLNFFSFNQEEFDFIKKNGRLLYNRIALGIILGGYKLIGRLQQKPEEAPELVIRFVARSLKLKCDLTVLNYSTRVNTRWDHDKLIRNYLGLSHFSSEQNQIIFDHLQHLSLDPGHLPDWLSGAEDYFRENRFVLPSNNVTRRLVLHIRYQCLSEVANNIYTLLGNKKRLLEDLLRVDENDHTKWYELTNRHNYSSTPAKLKLVLDRLKKLRNISINTIDFNTIPVQYIRYFSQRGMHLSSKNLKNHAPKQRYAIMASTLKELEHELTDIPIQMNDEILTGVFLRGKGRSERYLRKHRKTIRKVVSAFKFMASTVIDELKTPLEKINCIKKQFPYDNLEKLTMESDRLDIPRGTDDIYFASEGYQTIQKYLPDFIETLSFTSTSKDDVILKATEYYKKRKQDGKTGIGSDAPIDFILEKKWKRTVIGNDGKPKTKPWILCLAETLRKSFRQGSLEIKGTRQYRSLNSDLIPWKEWRATEINEDDRLPYTKSAESVVSSISESIQMLAGKYKQWTENETATIDKDNRIHLKKLDRMDEPESVIKLRPLLYGRLPSHSLPEMLVEADKLTGFSSYLTRLSSGKPFQKGDKKHGEALYAVLIAAACGTSLSKMEASSGISVELLRTVRDEAMRPQTIQAAMISLVNFYSRLPLALIHGSGDSSSSDGQGFPAEGRPLGALYNRKRFNAKNRGFIAYTHFSNNLAPFYTQLIPSTAREAIYVPDGLLYHGTSLMPREHYTDSHGFTDIVFAVLHLLGFRLAPRIANISDLKLWYGKDFNVDCPELFDGRIPLNSIDPQWDSMKRFMHTIYSGRARASQLIRKISSFSKKQPLFKAFRNLGRLLRSRHILEMAGNLDFRRTAFQELNKAESKNALAGDLRYVRKGAIRERTPEMQLCAVSATNLAILCISICNTIDMQKAIRSMKKEGIPVNLDDLRYISPFIHEHHNIYGHLSFFPIPGTNISSIEKAFEPL